jgi:MFS family permease
MDAAKRNYILMFADTFLFTNAMTLLSVTTVITYFLNSLGAGTFEIGLANALVAVGAFLSQPLFAGKVMNLHSKKQAFVRYLLIQRLFFLLFVLSIPFLAVSHPGLMVVLFLVCWTVFSFFTGSYGPFYISLFAKMVAVHQRGRLRGYAGGFGSLAGMGVAFMAGVILTKVAFPYNYTIIFAAGIVILLADVLCFAWMKEEPDQITPLDMKFFQYFKAIHGIMRENKKFKGIVASFCFIVASQVGLAYYVLYAVRLYGINASQIAMFTGITGLVNILGNIGFGILADKYSHRLILALASFSAALGGFLIIGVHELWAAYAAFGLSTLCLSGYNLSSGILIIENVKRENLPMCISGNNLTTLVVSAAVTLGSSFMIDYVSFASVFLAAAIFGLLGAALLYLFR